MALQGMGSRNRTGESRNRAGEGAYRPWRNWIDEGGHLAWPRRKRLELEGRTRTWSTAAAGWRWSTRRRPSMAEARAEVRAGGEEEKEGNSFLLGPWVVIVLQHWAPSLIVPYRATSCSPSIPTTSACCPWLRRRLHRLAAPPTVVGSVTTPTSSISSCAALPNNLHL
jgi:hypothetical protein